MGIRWSELEETAQANEIERSGVDSSAIVTGEGSINNINTNTYSWILGLSSTTSWRVIEVVLKEHTILQVAWSSV
jgi:hypothetical protein